MLKSERSVRVLYRIVLAVFILTGQVCLRAQSLDSLQRRTVSDKLTEYLDVISAENLDVQCEECDFLIESCSDSLVRQYVAREIYSRYADSDVMGAETVAVHIFDKWFADGTVRMDNDAEMLAAKIFVEFNRSSLLGMDAPGMTLRSMDGAPVSLFGDEPSDGRFKVLYFYDTDCASCKIQTILLRNVLAEGNFPIDLYAVYASDDFDAWKEYVRAQFDVDAGQTEITHLWDPDFDSDFQYKYGVIKTPRLFLVAPDGVILGRGLDAKALAYMLHGIFDEKELDYGSDESAALYDGIFGLSPSRKDIADVSDHIASTTLAKGDTVMFRQMMGDLLYYLGPRRGEGVKEGLSYIVDRHVLSRNDIWRTHDDSLKVTGYAEMVRDLLSLSRPGSLVADLKVPATLISSKKMRTSEFRLRRLNGKRNIMIFYTDGCHICAAEKDAASALARQEKGVKVLLVNVDEILSLSPSLADSLFAAFDLSSLPFILETDRKGRILRRYVSLLQDDVQTDL